MSNKQDEDKTKEGANDRDESAEKDSREKEDVDENAKGERPDNLRRRSEWFQKRHGGG